MEDLVEELQCSVEVHLDPARRLLNRLAVVIGAPSGTMHFVKRLHSAVEDLGGFDFGLDFTFVMRLMPCLSSLALISPSRIRQACRQRNRQNQLNPSPRPAEC